MKLSNQVLMLCLWVVMMPANAGNVATVLRDWYFSASLGYVDFQGHYNDSRLPLIGNDYYFSAKSVGGSIKGGYQLTEHLAMELAIRDSGNIANSNAYDAYFSEMAFTPAYRWKPSADISLSVRGGISLASYFMLLERVMPWADKELTWNAIGLTVGLGAEWILSDNVSLLIDYDYVDAKFQPQYDMAYNGYGFYKMPSINASLNRTAIGARYRF